MKKKRFQSLPFEFNLQRYIEVKTQSSGGGTGRCIAWNPPPPLPAPAAAASAITTYIIRTATDDDVEAGLHELNPADP